MHWETLALQGGFTFCNWIQFNETRYTLTERIISHMTLGIQQTGRLDCAAAHFKLNVKGGGRASIGYDGDIHTERESEREYVTGLHMNYNGKL